jgi:hypothetical protein
VIAAGLGFGAPGGDQELVTRESAAPARCILDLDAFYGSYRANGQGRAAYDPAIMVALLIHAGAMSLVSA